MQFNELKLEMKSIVEVLKEHMIKVFNREASISLTFCKYQQLLF